MALATASPVALNIVPGVKPVEFATVVSTWNVSALVPPSIDPAGITYLSHADRLLFSDSEINEEPTLYTGVNFFTVTRQGAITTTGRSPGTPVEPTGLAYNPTNRHVFMSNDQSERVYEITHGADGIYGTADDTVTSFGTAAFGAADPEDVAFDSVNGHLFIADGIEHEVFRVDPGPNGIFEGVGADDIITSFDVAPDGLLDAEGIEYRASSQTLLVVDAGSNESIYEYTLDGFMLRRIDLDAIQIVGVPETPADLAVAPASDGSGAPRLYLVDRKADNGDPNDGAPPPMDGTIYELSAPFNDLPPYVDAGSDTSTTVSTPVNLVGFAADDGQPLPTGLTVLWTKVSGPGTVTFGSATAKATTASFGAAGTYQLQLAASDTNATTTDTVTITVIDDPVGNTPPVVNAGADQAVILRDGAALTGSATDDGSPIPPGTLTYQWSKVAGPGSVTFGSTASSSTSVMFGTVGTYDLRLTASDGQLQASDVVRVVVEPNPPGTLVCTGPDFAGAGFTDLGGFSQETRTAVDCLVFHGISNGTSPTTFSPNQSVTRWQMALFLTRQATVHGLVLPDGSDQGFSDIAGFPASTQLAINQLAQLGITKGTTPTTFDPNAQVSRWQMALFLTRLLAETGMVLPSGTSGSFVDLGGLSAEATIAINQLAALEVALGTTPTTFSPSLVVARWQMALFLVRTLDVGGSG